jgi:hypothetical protein
MNKDDHHRRPASVNGLIILQLLLGLGAVGGGGALLAVPDGSILHMPLDILKYSPFSDFLIPGLILFVFIGLFPWAVAYGLWKQPGWRWPDRLNPLKRYHWSWSGSLASGVATVIWITVEVIMLRSAVFVHCLYWGWGLVIIILTARPSVRRYSSEDAGVGPDFRTSA